MINAILVTGCAALPNCFLASMQAVQHCYPMPSFSSPFASSFAASPWFSSRVAATAATAAASVASAAAADAADASSAAVAAASVASAASAALAVAVDTTKADM